MEKKYISSKEIREQFIEFFENKGHQKVLSAPVIPIDDPTLLFTNAGMNQFKNIFLGQTEAKFSRAVDSQKCIRAGGKHNDLEEVGKDGYHHTFFEMLGNWSFGDYYKKEAISWAWELFTDVWKFPKELLYATCFEDDKEAFEFWKSETDIDHSHIEFHEARHNFWEMGETGPCGPCSELHIDRGVEFCSMKDDPNHICSVNGDCHRYIELWNLVFIQFFRNKEGELEPLKEKFVDTGAGFERICQVLQNKDSNYETDLFQPIIEAIAKISKTDYFKDERGTTHRVIADHIRALTFAITDGGMPSNEGRGYVLRRILRRAARFGRLLNLHKPFLYKLVDNVVEVMGHHFDELLDKQSYVKMIIKAEEERFNLTLDKGLIRFEEIFRKSEHKLISGKDVFILYDTYGFPVDLTRILAEEKGYKIDMDSFSLAMDKQRKRAREAAKFNLGESNLDKMGLSPSIQTGFVGYNYFKTESKIIKFILDEKGKVIVVLDKTPFYAESGGQVSDIGIMYNEKCKIKIYNVQKENEVFLHFGKIVNGEIDTDDHFTIEIDIDNRKNISRNHTATHLLHKALKEVLGEHVQQKGSLVKADSLRFDFTHFKNTNDEEIKLVEKIVNKKIRECLKINTNIKSIEEAKKEGATALFGEKYGETVRVVSIGDFSKELCGGTHLLFTGEIGSIKIISESSTAAGIRRIEAVTGENAETYNNQIEDNYSEILRVLNVQKKFAIEKIEKLIADNKKFSIELEALKMKAAGNQLDKLLSNAKEVNGIKIIATKIQVKNSGEMRNIGDQLKGKLKSGIGVIASEINGKVSLLVIVSDDLKKQYHAGKIVGEIAKIVGGKGGGRPDMAMAGGKDVEKIDEALAKIYELI